jgi:cytoskeletal protein CcmA (bactofilin family)
MSLFNRNDKSGDNRQQTDAPQPKAWEFDVPQGPQQKAAPQKPESDTPKAAEPPAPIVPPPTTNQGASMASLISKALKITGELESTEDIQIDGQIDGDVRGVGVKIGQNAKVKGTVYGDEVELSGAIEGKIESKKVILGGTARMTGDVWFQDIKIESGAYISGNLKPELGKADAKPALKPVGPAASVSPMAPAGAPAANSAAAAHH